MILMRQKVIVVGAGASGLAAAISAARNGAQVLVLEQMDKPAKKILATGNGKCNYTNAHMTPDCFRSEDMTLCQCLLERFGTKDIAAFLGAMGIMPKVKDGYYYPYSMQAASVAEVLIDEALHLGVKILCKEKVLNIQKKNRQFTVKSDKNMYRSDAVILAGGGRAAAKLGSDGSCYKLARDMGLRVTTVVPALTGLKCSGRFFKSVSGVRIYAGVSIYECSGDDRQCLGSDVGEVQMTAYGISGIPVFQVSRYAAMALKNGQKVKAVMDFMPDMTLEDFQSLLQSRFIKMHYKTALACLTGMIPAKMIHLFLSSAAIDDDCMAGDVPADKVAKLAVRIKSFELNVIDTNTFEEAQVCAGGVDTSLISPKTMMVKNIPGLYIVGELLDVDGICGGYNLHFAWASGIAAGEHAGKGVTDQ